jgi:hypothetical protein
MAHVEITVTVEKNAGKGFRKVIRHIERGIDSREDDKIAFNPLVVTYFDQD